VTNRHQPNEPYPKKLAPRRSETLSWGMPSFRYGLILSATLAAVQLASAQTIVNSVFTPHGLGYYGDANNWSPPEVPNNTPDRIYNVTIQAGVTMNVDATVSDLTLTGLFYNRGNSLAVAGLATLEDPYLAIYSYDGDSTFSAGSLSTLSGGTLTGTYEFSNAEMGSTWATLQIGGADVRKLSGATVSLVGPRTRLVDEFGNDGLRNLAHIDAGSTLSMSGQQRVIAGPFTNDGSLSIGNSSDQPGLFTVTGVLTNFDTASRTLTGGYYGLGGYTNQPAVFQFAGADIVHNAATIGLTGPLAKITDDKGNDALRNFVHNTPAGILYVGQRDFSLSGNFTNEGVLSAYSATLSVAGSLTNFDPATRTLTGGTYEVNNLGAGPAGFIFPGADIVNNAASIHLRWEVVGISDENGNDALRNFAHNLPGGEFTITDAHVITAPADFTNAGSINVVGYFTGDISYAHLQIPEGYRYIQTAGRTLLDGGRFTGAMEINGGSLITAANVNFPPTAAHLEGDLTVGDAFLDPLAFVVNGSVQLQPGAQLLTPSKGYDHFWVSGTFTAGGTLQISAPRFRPASTDRIPVLSADGGVVGTFGNAPIGGRVPTVDGLGTFVVSYTPNDISISGYQASPPAAQLLNISTRAHVWTGNDVVIGGFIVFGNSPKRVIVRGIGPSLSGSGIGGVLLDPTLELHGADGTTIAVNDNWQDNQAAEILASGLAPSDDRESAIIAVLTPGAYTTVLAGKNGTTGVGLVEGYDLASEVQSKVANLSTRGLVDPDNVLIGGFIIGGSGQGNAELVVRGIGPLLSQAGVTGFLPDPTLEVRNSNGTLYAFNDDFDDAPENLELIDPSLQMYNAKDAAIPATLPPGNFTAIVRGKNGASGTALVEVYDMNR
jgi:hypothetical protein